MIQMTAPGLQVLANYFVLRKPVSTRAALAVPVVVVGGILSAVGEYNFSAVGLCLSAGAMVCRVARVSLAEQILAASTGTRGAEPGRRVEETRGAAAPSQDGAMNIPTFVLILRLNLYSTF